MKVLWLTVTPSKYKPLEFGYNGRGWIESLQTLVENSTENIQLGIAFPHSTDNQKVVESNVTYYPIKRVVPRNILNWIISNWAAKIEEEDEFIQLRTIIEDFNPDIIHIYGTESWMCKAIEITNIPCLVHLQGLMLPYLNVYVPNGISTYQIISHSWIEFLKGISFWHNSAEFKKMSIREYTYLKKISWFMGRTTWDHGISKFLSPKSTYFHVDEVLRESFYDASPWTYKDSEKIIITSTLSDTLYKGLDLVIKTAKLLTNEGIKFEWRVIGIKDASRTALLFKKKFHITYDQLNIKLMGIKEAKEIVRLLSETKLYIHPSHIDNSPNSLCEAQLMGVPIIATNVGGVSSLIQDGVDGYLVPANDPYFLASRIVELSNSPACITKFSEYARINAKKRHSKETILNDLVHTYQLVSTYSQPNA